MPRQWFAVRTKPRQEQYAKEQFSRQGFEVYLPQTLVLISHARKKGWVERPFFPGYMFLNLAIDEQRWSSIASTYGAVGAVSFGTQYPSIPNEVINTLKAHENEQGVILCESRPSEPFRPEQKIRVICGPMRDLEGIFQVMGGKDRVLILMELLNRTISVRLPLEQVAAS